MSLAATCLSCVAVTMSKNDKKNSQFLDSLKSNILVNLAIFKH